MFTYEQALNESIAYFGGSDLPAKIFVDKYALRDSNNNILESTSDQMHRRLAKEFARIERNKFATPLAEEEIYDLFKNYGCIIPQGSPIYGIGNPHQVVSISNCFVLDEPEDSYGGILRVDEQLVHISKRRGGVGISLNKLRPKGFRTSNASHSSTGILSWMTRYSNSIREVGQNGRRGALMLTLNVHHPDIEDFITAKNDGVSVTGANISVHLTDEFLSAVENNEEYEQRFPLENPTFTRKISAKKIWDMIIHNAWLRAEPGIQFIDLVKKESPADCYEWFITCTSNPCGEIFLSILDSCRLMAINLFCCVVNPFHPPHHSDKYSYFDYQKLYKIAQIAQRLMDDLVDLELECIDRILNKLKNDPEPDDVKHNEIEMWNRIKWACVNGRRTGLGITAIGDVLAALGVRYDSDEAIQVTDEIYKTLKMGSYRSSVDMAKELGPFPKWDWQKEKDNPFLKRIKDEIIYIGNSDPRMHEQGFFHRLWVSGEQLYKDMEKYGRRNIANLTTAPTGCSVGSSMIISNIGILRFDELITEKDHGFYNIPYLEVPQERKTAQVTKKFVNGISKTKKILLDSGLELESTNNHQYRVYKDNKYTWKRVDELKIGDILVNRIGGYNKTTNELLKEVDLNEYHGNCNLIKLPSIINNDFAELLGIMYADGSIHDRNIRIHIDRNEIDLINRIVYLYKIIFNIDAKVIQERTCAVIYANSQILIDFLRINGCLKEYSQDVKIPKCIRQSSMDVISSFIHGYWCGDGSESRGLKYIDTVSHQMAQELSICLRALGQNTHITKYENRENSLGNLPIYRVRFIGFGSMKFNKYRYIKTCDKLLLTDIRKYGEQLCFDRIENIEDSENFTYDIEVPENNCYILNSYISHNTISTQAGMFVDEKWYYGTTSGIESLYKESMVRRKKGNPGDQHFRSDFVDKSGDHWMEFTVNHPGIQACKDIGGTHAYVEADKIVWTQKVKLQAAAQKHVDHSISVTCNLPENIKEEEVAKIYMEAWKSGCKGFTVYRENCRSGVLIDPSKAANNSNRPKELPCDVYHISVSGKSYFVLVGLKDGEIFELFAGKNGFLSKSIKTGKIIKYKKGYKAIFEDETELCPITSMCQDEEQVITRMTSLSIQWNVPLDEIVDQLEKIPGDMNSFARGLSRTVKRYIKSGTLTQESCPECGKKIKYQEGCKSCDCGWSKCS